MDTTIPYSNASGVSFFDGCRAGFYLFMPWESVFEKSSQVPDYVSAVVPHFFVLIILELLIIYWKGKDLRLNDKITCLGAGIYSQILIYAGLKTMEYSLYAYVYNHYRVYALPWDSSWTWILMFFVCDLAYYWFHRMAHEVNVLWTAHQTHHSSEDYTFSTALRQSATQSYTSTFFYLPAALFFPPSSFTVHKQLNLLYQFWIHTELVDSLGPLEYFLNTPSHHRVHHGRNPYCIDKNYAAVLIIWDRMFGTFQPERRNEKVVYGLVHPVNTFDSNYLQISPYTSFIERFWKHEGVTNKLKFSFHGPGWIPGKPRLGDVEDIPKIEDPVQIYDPKVSSWLSGYVLLHFLLCTSIYNQVGLYHLSLPIFVVLGASVFSLFSLTCFGYLFDKRSFALKSEFLRCSVCAVLMYSYGGFVSSYLKMPLIMINAITIIFALSSIIWITDMLSNSKHARVKSS